MVKWKNIITGIIFGGIFIFVGVYLHTQQSNSSFSQYWLWLMAIGLIIFIAGIYRGLT